MQKWSHLHVLADISLLYIYTYYKCSKFIVSILSA